MAVLTEITVRPELSPRLIIVEIPLTELVLQDLHDSICAWQDRPPNHDYDVIIDSAGKEDLPGSVEVAITTTLRDAQVMFRARVEIESQGTVTTPDTTGVVLNDSGGDFLSTVTRGDIVLNATDGSKATVLDVVSNAQLRTDGLSGGSDDQFDSADVYRIFDVVPCTISGGNLTAIDDVGAPLSATLPSFGTQLLLAFSSSATIVTAGGLVPTQQQIRDSAKLAASSGLPAGGSIDTKLDNLGYADGVWIDPNNGVAGTVVGVNGLRGNPVDTIADAETIAAAVGVREFQLVTGTFTLMQAHTEWSFVGHAEVELLLNGQNVNGSTFTAANAMLIKGVMTGRIAVEKCRLEDITGLQGEIHDCGLSGTIVLGGSESTLDRCHSNVVGVSEPVLDFGGIVGASANIRAYSGGMEFAGMSDVTNVCTIDYQSGQVQIDADCTDGTLVLRGRIGKKVDNSAGTTIIDQRRPDARVSIISDGATPDNIEVLAWLEREGEPLIAGLVSASVTFRQPDGTGVFGPTALTLDAVRGVFRASVSSVALANATNYYADLTITDASGTVQAYQAQPTLAA